MAPKHDHDCDCCVFLGSLNGTDHYFCPSQGELVQRLSSRDDDYRSMPLAVVRQIPAPHHYELTLALLAGAVHSPSDRVL